jgi:capsular polysaccharide biosynthesis protein
MKLIMIISIFFSFIHYVAGLFILKTKIEGMTAILFVNDFDDVTNKIFVFDTKILKFCLYEVEISNEILYK